MGKLVDMIEAAKNGNAKAAGQHLVEYFRNHDIGYSATDDDSALEAQITIERRPVSPPEG